MTVDHKDEAAAAMDAGPQEPFASIEEALTDLREGRFVIVCDDEDRENEGDLTLAAQFTTAERVNFMAREARGLICLALTPQRCAELNLPPMVSENRAKLQTAFTVSIEARDGVTTGISAADRARTLRVLADPAAGPKSIIRPGHVLPLRAVPGGVLHRGGHTEAAVDLCRLAGLEPVAGIAELVHDDGSMMRLADAAALAEREGLVVLTIADLAAWRRAHGDVPGPGEAPPAERRVLHTAAATLPTRHGRFVVHGYRDLRTGAGHAALVVAEPTDPREVPLVRVHSECLTGDAFGSLRCDCGPQLEAALARVAVEGGAVVYLRGHEGRGIGLLSKIAAYALQDSGRDTVQANLDLGLPADRREYGAAAAILADLGLDRVRLLTNNPAKATGLSAHGIAVEQVLPHEVGRTRENLAYLRAKAQRMGHLLSPETLQEEAR